MLKQVQLSRCVCLLCLSAVFVLQASVAPGESGLVTVVGTGVLKVFKLADQTLKPVPLNANRRDTLSFTCQVWLPLGDKGDAAGGGGSSGGGAGDAAKGAAGSSDRERQLLGTVDGEVLLFEVRVKLCLDVAQCVLAGAMIVLVPGSLQDKGGRANCLILQNTSKCSTY